MGTPIAKKNLTTNTPEEQAQKHDNLGAQGCTCKCTCQNSIIQDIKGVTDLKSFQLIMDKKWDDKIFQETKIEVGNPLSEEDIGVKVLLTEPNNPEMRSSIQKLYREKYPEVEHLQGVLEIVEQTTRIKGQSTACTWKIIEIKQDGSVPDVWRKLSELRDETANDAKTDLHHITGMIVEILGRMVETIFRTSSTQIKIYTTEKKTRKKRSTKTSKYHYGK
ncbi:hypothetical protein JTB14_023090 [Gonioctena quinquepunctata]|nr:hypothetical protein JTB14_023090 [Gonioctena quinquepunctata]